MPVSKGQQYLNDVLSGKQIVGPWIRKFVERHQRDLETGASRGLYFDPVAGEYVCDFVEEFCIPPNQDTAMVLMGWQAALLLILYGWKRADGSRRFRRVYCEVAKKAGKTALVAALCIYHLIADGERSARIFVAATTRKQAGICFKEAVAMVGRHPDLKAMIQQAGIEPVHALFIAETGSRVSMMARDAASEDGAMVSMACLDEIHRWKADSNLYPVLRYGGRTRRQPLLWEITTAGSSTGGTSLCWNEREYGCKVLSGHVVDDEFCPVIFCMDPKDDWKDSANWIKSNPSLGTLFDLATIEKEYNEAIGKPASIGEFKRFALNVWSSEAEDPAIELERWDACCREDISKHPDPKRLRRESLEELRGRACFLGLDQAPKNDTSSLVALFPPLKTGEKWRILCWFWVPEDNIEDRVRRDRVPYDRWNEDGFLTATPGNLTDVRFIADELLKINEMFDVREIDYDEAWSSELIRMLEEAGFPIGKLKSHPQSHLKMNAPFQELLRKILRQEIAHDNDPVARWQVSNLRLNTQKGTGFIKPDKGSKREKIDFCSSLIMALSAATSPDNIIRPKRKGWAIVGSLAPDPAQSDDF